ncbi:pilus assembly protein [Pleionea sp. CnH1-48]|uniref:pilus assembly protein n=1 Tax=Pleionea sp. CnH1-48 TaxID=2954494 RepID=UPI0020971018|nr:PilC/PilY family type IV pilus protein [Pleionea sp. CnH1-48]MCO7222869.1 PilC/PilY family type IV pilus protein [Pleionea sp. CnH1-48]
MKTLLNKFKWIALASIYCLATTGTAFAEDTEIFFSNQQQTTTTPNILFIFDTSGSMSYVASGSSTNESRINIMRNVLLEYLDTVNNVNIGLARFSVPGGPILQPVVGVSQPAAPVITTNVSGSSNDATQTLSNGVMSLTSRDLDLTTNSMAGIRFTGVNVPQGATITSATLTFSTRSDSSGAASFTITGQDSDNASEFTWNNSDLTSRAKTSASETWTPGDWEAPGTDVNGDPLPPNAYTSTNVRSIVQEIVDRNGWCGDNSMAFFVNASTGFRRALSYDGDTVYTPKLTIEYDSTLPPGASGCFVRSVSRQVSMQEYDFEYTSWYSLDTYSYTLDFYYQSKYSNSTNAAVGLYFDDLDIPQGANIIDSFIEFVAYDTNNAYAQINISAVNSANPSSGASDIRYASKTGSISWVPPTYTPHRSVYSTSSLNTIINGLVSKAGWTNGNSMAFWLRGGAGRKQVYSFRSPVRAPRLVVKYKTVFDPTVFTKREVLKSSVNDFQASGNTPISDTLMEAARYMRGDPVYYGAKRGSGRSQYNRVSSVESFESSGVLFRPAGCSDDNLNSSNCRYEEIFNSPKYISPIQASCQSNHVVLLTDGAPTSHNSATATTYNGWTGNTCQLWDAGKDCSNKIVAFMKNEDQGIGVSGTQTVTTHAIGFDYSSSFLQDLAEVYGGGLYKTADDRASLLEALQSITDSVLKTNNTFVSAGVTVNQYNRLTHNDELYFSLFEPSTSAAWPGNIKRYALDQVSRNIVDEKGDNAVNAVTGEFDDSASSYWSTEIDGNIVKAGGVANKLGVNRRIFTQLGSTKDLTASSNRVRESNSTITQEMLGAIDAADRTGILQWARGYDVDGNDPSAAHNNVGDPLHSQPVLLSYSDGSGVKSSIYAGTNHGFVHSFNSDDGTENWAFIPQELLSNLKLARENEDGADHFYGIDGSVALFHQDTDDDGLVDSGEKAYLYVGMRRGGKSYYALDISDRTAPRLMFNIKAGSSGFENMGQTWSTPVIGYMKIGSGDAPKLVMMFGGGYDTTQDTEDTVANTDAEGNRVYIVDALSGTKLWDSSMATQAGGAAGPVSSMNAVPGNVKAFDLNGDNLLDKFYVSDTKAQIFRFDIDHDTKKITGGRIAHLGDVDQDTASENRRFYYNPDVSIVRDSNSGERYMSVAIGSGYRAHPLNKKVKDHFYVLRDKGALTNSWPMDAKIGDLLNATNVLGDADADGISDAAEQIQDNDLKGWYVEFPTTGEKVLAESITFNGVIVFTTYIPPGGSNASCQPAAGSGRAFAVNIQDGSPYRDTNFDGSVEANDRYVDLNSVGIPPAPQILLPSGSGKPITLIGRTPIEDLVPELPKTLMPIKWQHK